MTPSAQLTLWHFPLPWPGESKKGWQDGARVNYFKITSCYSVFPGLFWVHKKATVGTHQHRPTMAACKIQTSIAYACILCDPFNLLIKSISVSKPWGTSWSWKPASSGIRAKVYLTHIEWNPKSMHARFHEVRKRLSSKTVPCTKAQVWVTSCHSS